MAGFRLSKVAVADLRSIARYTKDKWGTAQRDRCMRGLNDEFEVLSLNPRMAAERDDFYPPVRIHQYKRHLIIYLVDDDGLLIVRVLHQSMNVPAHLSS